MVAGSPVPFGFWKSVVVGALQLDVGALGEDQRLNFDLGSSPGLDVACPCAVDVEGACLDDVSEVDERRRSS